MFGQNVSQLSLHSSGSAGDCRGGIVQPCSTCEILIVIVPCIYCGCDHNETVHHHATKPPSHQATKPPSWMKLYETLTPSSCGWIQSQ